MKVLVLNGSPKCGKSNTMHLTRSFLEGAGWSDAEIIHVAKIDLKPCLGCFSCWKKTPGDCVIHDEMAEILAKIIAADVIIWSFPLYYYGIPGHLKDLIDRQLPMNLPFMKEEGESGSHPSRYDLSLQRRLVISTCGFWTASGNYDSVSSMFDHIYGKEHYAAIFCGQGELFRIPELKSSSAAYLELVSRAGAEYLAGGIKAETMKSLAQPLYPRKVYEQMADASWGIQKENGEVAADDSFQFTIQMAALYKPDGIERVLELSYTDIGKTYQILMTKQGSSVIEKGLHPYTTKIETPYALWRSIARNETSGQEALFQHRYKVLGDFSLMVKWDNLFGSAAPPIRKEKTPNERTNIMVLLAPWIVIWIGIAVNPVIGGGIAIAVIAALPLIWLRFRPVIYEQITVPVATGLSLAALLGVNARLVVSGSYLLFGLMWLIGAFPSIPLSAHYSAMGYGGEKAFSNPLFIKTNRILTFCWGCLYLITPIWTYILMGTSLSPYIGLVNSILPAFMGVFTARFQRWYPQKFARG